MRSRFLLAAVAAVAVAAPASAADGLVKGSPAVKSISALAFGPGGVLFLGDPAAATVFAVDTGDTTPAATTADVSVAKVDEKVAGLLGVAGKDVVITDVKVNPASGNVYLAATRAKGATPVVVRVGRDGKLAEFPLTDVPFASVKLPNATGEAITSMAFVGGQLVVAGLSTEEFASTLRAIPYPFKEADKGTGVEIFHGAHGKLETKSPVRTFVTYTVGGADFILAAYTCTPLVRVPVADLKPGAKVKGTTIAELGNRNKPLDMVVYTKDGKDFILMANSARGVMKIPAAGVESAVGITTKPKELTAGVPFETVAGLTGVMHLDKLDAGRALLLVKGEAGFDLKTIPLP